MYFFLQMLAIEKKKQVWCKYHIHCNKLLANLACSSPTHEKLALNHFCMDLTHSFDHNTTTLGQYCPHTSLVRNYSKAQSPKNDVLKFR